MIDIGDWPKAKHHWLRKCLQMKETESNLASVTFNCFGAINDYFIKVINLSQFMFFYITKFILKNYYLIILANFCQLLIDFFIMEISMQVICQKFY